MLNVKRNSLRNISASVSCCEEAASSLPAICINSYVIKSYSTYSGICKHLGATFCTENLYVSKSELTVSIVFCYIDKLIIGYLYFTVGEGQIYIRTVDSTTIGRNCVSVKIYTDCLGDSKGCIDRKVAVELYYSTCVNLVGGHYLRELSSRIVEGSITCIVSYGEEIIAYGRLCRRIVLRYLDSELTALAKVSIIYSRVILNRNSLAILGEIKH